MVNLAHENNFARRFGASLQFRVRPGRLPQEPGSVLNIINLCFVLAPVPGDSAGRAHRGGVKMPGKWSLPARDGAQWADCWRVTRAPSKAAAKTHEGAPEGGGPGLLKRLTHPLCTGAAV